MKLDKSYIKWVAVGLVVMFLIWAGFIFAMFGSAPAEASCLRCMDDVPTVEEHKSDRGQEIPATPIMPPTYPGPSDTTDSVPYPGPREHNPWRAPAPIFPTIPSEEWFQDNARLVTPTPGGV